MADFLPSFFLLSAFTCFGIAFFFSSRSSKILGSGSNITAKEERESLLYCRHVQDNPSIRAILQDYNILTISISDLKDPIPPHFIFTNNFVHDMLAGKSYPLNYTCFRVQREADSYSVKKTPNMLGPALIGVTLGYGVGLTSALAKESEYKTKYTYTDNLAIVYDPSTAPAPCPLGWTGSLLLADDLISQLPDNYNYSKYTGLSLSTSPSNSSILYSLCKLLNEMLLQGEDCTLIEQSKKLNSLFNFFLILAACLLLASFIIIDIISSPY